MDGESKPPWTFLTNHAHVLVCIAEEPDIRGRDIASRVGITERAAQAIVADLVNEGYVTRTREGRRNHYAVNPDAPLRHPLEHDHSIGELLVTLGRLQPTRRRRSRRSA
ncbi:MAG: winged helix-turn-helix domain-containing protein [Actinomycetota bacterium]